MNSILNNPYRILGLPITASERDVAKRISDLEIYAEMGKTKHFDTDFPFLSPLQRTPETIREASNQIEQSENKLFYSLFWFWENNSTDELAFDLLKDVKIKKAIMIWKKVVKEEIITKNYSATKNAAVLCLGLAINNGELREKLLIESLHLFGKIFDDNLFDNYARTIVGSTHQINKEKIIRSFVDEVFEFTKPYFDKNNGIATLDFLEIFEYFPGETHEYVYGKFINEPIYNIETEIEKTSNSRENNPYEAFQYGKELYNNTHDDLEYLKSLLSESDLQYQIVADKLAEEIITCTIDYHNKIVEEDDEYNPEEGTLNLANLAFSIAVGERVIDRIAETIAAYEQWIPENTKKEVFLKIQSHFNYIGDKIKNLPDLKTISSDGIKRLPSTTQRFLDDCKDRLLEIKDIIGSQNEYYLDVSSAVANYALNMCIEYANQTHEYDKVLSVLKIIGTLDMVPELMERYNKNKKILESNNAQKLIEKLFENNTVQNIKSKPESTTSRNIYWIVIILVFVGIIVFFGTVEDNSATKKRTGTGRVAKMDSPAPVLTHYKGNSLKNGSSPYNSLFGKGVYNKSHNNWILFKNGQGADAIVCLVNCYSGRTIRNEYIRAGTTFKMTNIPNGTYYIKAFFGKDWNPNKTILNGKGRGAFDTDNSFMKCDNQDDLIQLEDNGYRYSTGTMTLYTVASGNVRQKPINQYDFFN